MSTTPATGLHGPRPDVGFPLETEEGRRGRVLVDVGGETVEISRRDRDTLLKELCFVAGSESIRRKFEAVAEGRSVELDPEQRSQLREALEVWVRDGIPPDGIARLLAALARADARATTPGM